MASPTPAPPPPTVSSPSSPLPDLPAETVSSDPTVDSEITSSLCRRSRRRSSLPIPAFFRHHRESQASSPRPAIQDPSHANGEEDEEVNQEGEEQQREWEDAERKGGGTIELRIRRSGTDTPERSGKSRSALPGLWRRKDDKIEGDGRGFEMAETGQEGQQPGGLQASTSTQGLPSPPSSSQIPATSPITQQSTTSPTTATSTTDPTSQPPPPVTKSVNLTSSSPTEVAEAKKEMKKQRGKVKEEYVWDVLFENQRGIMFLGRPHFSSSTLFPFDPPAFTVPSHIPRPSPVSPTTKDSAKRHPPSHQVLDTGSVFPNSEPRMSDKGKKEGKKKDKTPHQKQSINTPYTPQTYQLPSSDWIWLTPWLINMRQDGLTDERGWEYNYFFRSGSGKEKKFKKKGRGGWGCEVGKLGWGGWVRRRMWVRLRMLVVQSDKEEEEEEEEEEETAEDGELEATPTSPFSDHGFDEEELDLPDHGKELDVKVIVKAMAERSLDRERLDMWKAWLGDPAEKGKNTAKGKKQDAVVKIKQVLEDEDNVDQIMSAVTYDSTRRSLLALWKEQGIEVEA